MQPMTGVLIGAFQLVIGVNHMERSARRKAVIGGSTLVMAGALAGVIAFGAGEHDATTRPSAAGAVRAQRVDADNPAPSVQPSTTGGVTAQPSPGGTPAASGHITVRVKNNGSVGARACVTNTVSGKHCTNTVNTGQQDTLDVDVKAPDTRADLLVQVDTDPQGHGREAE
jgi:hypothetical protein